MSACHHVGLSSCRLVIMSACHHVCLSSCLTHKKGDLNHPNLISGFYRIRLRRSFNSVLWCLKVHHQTSSSLLKYFIWRVWLDPGMIHKVLKLIFIFGADIHTNRGVTKEITWTQYQSHQNVFHYTCVTFEFKWWKSECCIINSKCISALTCTCLIL